MSTLLVAIVFLLLVAFPPPVAHVAALNPPKGRDWQAFMDALRERGWVEGRDRRRQSPGFTMLRLQVPFSPGWLGEVACRD